MTVKRKQNADEPGGGGIPARSEDLLSEIEAIKVTLDNKQVVALNVKEELCVSDDPVQLVEEARHAADRFAFWAYQYARARGRRAAQKLKTEATEGERGIAYRKMIHESEPFDPTTPAVESFLANDPDVRSARVLLNRHEMECDVLRAMKDAMNHRCFVLTRLIALEAKQREG